MSEPIKKEYRKTLADQRKPILSAQKETRNGGGDKILADIFFRDWYPRK